MNGISHAGLPFTDSSKPTFCVQLKVQLDCFLSTWGEEQLPKGGRTAGSATDITKHLQRLLGQRMKRMADEQSSTDQGQAKRPKLINTEEDGESCSRNYPNSYSLPAETLSNAVH